MSKLILNYSGTDEHKYTPRKVINSFQFRRTKKNYVISTCWKRSGMVRHCLVLHLYPFKNCQCQDHLFYYFVSSPGLFYSLLTSGLTPTKQDRLYRLSHYHPTETSHLSSTTETSTDVTSDLVLRRLESTLTHSKA